MRARNGREQDGRDGRMRRKLGRVTVAIELVRNEGERAFYLYLGRQSYPLGSKTSVNTQANVIISRGGRIFRVWLWIDEVA
jgi:hypothetical protein